MHIKQIFIQNFKSYKYEVITDLNLNINIIIGKNGQGKSNFFNAISFVLTDKYIVNREEERRALLTNDVDITNQNIVVEILFDNTDKKIPIEQETISLKRTVYPDCKSEYQLNQKVITKNELENILDCVGLSRSNPYFIIQQGKISKIAQMNEEELYNLLQEIIGIKQYETKKNDAMKYLNDTKKEQDRIKDIIKDLDKKFNDLSEEKHEFDEEQEIEKKIKVIEYCICQKYIKELQEKLDDLKSNQDNLIETILKVKNREIESLTERDNLKQEIANDKLTEQQLKIKHQNLEKDLLDLNRHNEKLTTQIKSSKSDTALIGSQKGEKMQIEEGNNSQKAKEEMNRLLRLSASKQEEINDTKGKIREISKNMDSTLFLEKTVYDGESKKEHHTSMINRLTSIIENNIESINDSKQIIENNQQKIGVLNKTIETLEKDLAGREQKLDSITKHIIDLNNQHLENSSKIRSLLYQINAQTISSEQKKKDLAKMEKTLELTFKDNLFYTIQTVQNLIKARDIPGVHGLFLDLITIPEKLNICCDIMVHNKLFGFVVDNLETAEKLLALNKEIKGSAINIYPISWISDLKPKQFNYPHSQDAIILKNYIKPKPNLGFDLTPLVNNTFGRIIFVRNYELANKLSKEYNLNCVTSDGEVVYAGSYLTKLGFYDVRQEKISMYQLYKRQKEEVEKLTTDLANMNVEKDKNSNADLRIGRELQQALMEKMDTNQKIIRIKNEIGSLKDDKKVSQKLIEENMKYITTYEDENKKTRDTIDILQKDLESGAPVGVKGTSKDQKGIDARMTEMPLKIQQLRDTLRMKNNELQELNKRIEVLKEQLEGNHGKDMDGSKESASPMASVLPQDKRFDTMLLEKEQAIVQNQLYNSKAALDKVKEQKAKIQEDIKEKENTLIRFEKDHELIVEEKGELEERLSTINFKKLAIEEQKDSYQIKKSSLEFTDMGSLTQYQNKNVKELMAIIEQSGHIRRKLTSKDRVLLERLDTLKEKYSANKRTIRELQKNEEEIEQLIEKFDTRSEDTLVKVFKTFSNYFEAIFSKITLGGRTSVKLIKEKTNKRGAGVTHDKYTGIDIRVKFTRDDHDGEEEDQIREPGIDNIEWNHMSKLSLGQKTVVAISLIFALQRCDPAPIYILDEIDAALDANYRMNIYQIINEASQISQYFISSFKSDITMLERAKYYEVRFQDHTSRVVPISREQAINFLGVDGSRLIA